MRRIRGTYLDQMISLEALLDAYLVDYLSIREALGRSRMRASLDVLGYEPRPS